MIAAVRAVERVARTLRREIEAEEAAATDAEALVGLVFRGSRKKRDRIIGLLLEALGIRGARASVASSFGHIERAVREDGTVSERISKVYGEGGRPSPAALARVLDENPAALFAPSFQWELERLSLGFHSPFHGTSATTWGELLGFRKGRTGFPGRHVDAVFSDTDAAAELPMLMAAFGRLFEPSSPSKRRDVARLRLRWFERFRRADGWDYAAFERETGIAMQTATDKARLRKQHERERRAARNHEPA